MANAYLQSSQEVKFTYEDYRQLPDDGKRYEIIDGELYMSTAPTPNHQKSVRNFLFALTLYLKKHPIGEVIPAPLEVLFSQTNLAQPDIIYISNERLNIIKPEQVKGTPDLVIEVLSPATEKRDRTVKLKMYAKFGVQEYWMAKEKTSTLEVLRLQEGELVPVARLGKSDMLTSPLFPGLEIPLSEIFDI
ncbi:MAG: Uma2 family endonuclease [candidate division KSB1 bacterium]|nr:Uma2 family endonuclease [candidate division KSB1 bacterium]MDZ7305053.1 Uma2 family endonuclease [candidate division KSB1 bacterium]MDZ7313820.1 Uma2 family endonuclease [candidate division KSB1 bacterium]